MEDVNNSSTLIFQQSPRHRWRCLEVVGSAALTQPIFCTRVVIGHRWWKWTILFQEYHWFSCCTWAARKSRQLPPTTSFISETRRDIGKYVKMVALSSLALLPYPPHSSQGWVRTILTRATKQNIHPEHWANAVLRRNIAYKRQANRVQTVHYLIARPDRCKRLLW